MTEFLMVLAIALLASFLTWLGVPIAERFDVSQRIVSAALQFAAGIITALVAFSLMPPAVRGITRSTPRTALPRSWCVVPGRCRMSG